jgi:hypothetical protein
MVEGETEDLAWKEVFIWWEGVDQINLALDRFKW